MNLSRLDDVEEADEEDEEDGPKLTGVVPITVLSSLDHFIIYFQNTNLKIVNLIFVISICL